MNKTNRAKLGNVISEAWNEIQGMKKHRAKNYAIQINAIDYEAIAQGPKGATNRFSHVILEPSNEIPRYTAKVVVKR